MKKQIDVGVMMFLDTATKKLQKTSSDILTDIIKEIQNFKPDYSDYQQSEDILKVVIKAKIRDMEYVDKQLLIIKETEYKIKSGQLVLSINDLEEFQSWI